MTTRLIRAIREVLTASAFFAAVFSTDNLAWPLTDSTGPWRWVSYLGWTLGFLGAWIGMAPRLTRWREEAANALAAVAAVGVTLLGVLASDIEIAGPMLSGLGVVGFGLWVLRRAVSRARDREEARRHEEVLDALRCLGSVADPAGSSSE